ncbi:MAG TPA: endonuclease [Bacilli bacterium]|nr:endonuclease [Bacilli bacterium]
MKFNKLISVSILALLISGTSLTTTKQKEKVSAATPMPTNINMTNRTDAEVSAYYEGVNGKSGDALLAFLYTKIKNHNEYDYASATHRTIYKIIDRNWALDALDPNGPANTSNFNYSTDNGFIRKLYADYNDNIATADRFKNDGASRVSFDKEHIWAQSLGNFGRTRGAGSDFHSLWPADVKGNRDAHSNYNFAVPKTSITTYKNDYGTYVGRNGYISGYSQKVFEPLDQYKGDIARAMFYMPARYYEYIDATHPKLELVNGSPAAVTASSSVTGKAGDLATLLEWHELDPVDEYEIRRNNLIANNYQGNRNPFIDYPQWARIAYDPTYTGAGATNAPETSSVGTNPGGLGETVLSHITVDTTDAKTTYFLGDGFTTNSLIVTAHFSDETSLPVLDYTSSIANGTALNTPGNQSVTISYTHEGVTKNTSYTILVKEFVVSDYLFISEVYGGGGNAGAEYKTDFIELYNYADFPLSLEGYSVQYASAAGTSWQVTNLSGTIAPKSFYLIEEASGSGGTRNLPLAETVGSIPMHAESLKLALVNSTTALSGANPTSDTSIIDFVGVGTANEYLGLTAAPEISNTMSAQRKFIIEGIAPPVEKSNGTDFIAASPTPTNAALTIAVDIRAEGDTPNQCLTLYSPYKSRVLSLSPSQLNYFKTVVAGEEQRLTDGRARYEAWALHLGDALPYEYNENFGLGNTNKHTFTSDIVMLVLVIALFGLSIGFYFIKSKQNTAKKH